MSTTLVDIIQFLSVALMGFISYVLKMLWADMKSMRNELTVLQTEHKMVMECGGHHRRKDDKYGEESK